MIIVDAHRDIAFDYFGLGRDYRLSVAETRARESQEAVPGRKGPALTGLSDAIAAGIAVVGAVIFAEPARYEVWGGMPPGQNFSGVTYNTPEEARDQALKQLDWYEMVERENEQVRIVRSQGDLDAVLATWREGADPARRVQGWILLLEGADPLVEPEEFEAWHARGLRILGTSWTRTRYAGGTRAPGPLTDMGRRLLPIMAAHSAILDVTHMSEEACLEALGSYEGPLIASHSNPRRFSDTDRHLSDEAVKLLAERDGVLGLVLLNLFWMDTYDAGKPVPLSRVLDAVDYVCQLTGSAAHVGIGTDWYAGMGNDETPEGLDSVADLPKLADGLRGRGYSEADVTAIMAGNMLRQYRKALK